ncbi:hypothetical protein PHYPO_G00149610 [Pangasianodon hypophthalmus]|uniref:C-type lectin domain-containing protein n=2 Tax=Pangasianodon hypophthalmus TaxID=310915 RepID=A0A5N5JW44_PANHP|nr:hypothetical protein PHYPO_G00149610 [Pangasianodon hypophthalmus]
MDSDSEDPLQHHDMADPDCILHHTVTLMFKVTLTKSENLFTRISLTVLKTVTTLVTNLVFTTMKILIVFVLLMLAFSGYEAKSVVGRKCPEGWTGFGRKCYKYITEAKPWAEAEKYCQIFGGNLASVHSNQTHFILKGMGKISNSYKRTWIGAQDATQESVWLWSDGSVFDFSLWHSGEPNNSGGVERCVEMNYDGEVLWNDARCDTNLYFVCQKSANIPNIC